MTILHQLKKATYIDQHGFDHECYLVIDIVKITRSDEFWEYDYYDSPVKNWYWDSEDGRRWMCHTQTDFGGSAGWTRRHGEDNANVPNEKWIRDDRKPDADWGKPHWYGGTPIIFGGEPL